MELRFCLRCDGPCRVCKAASQKKNENVSRALAQLERGNLSPSFNQVAPWLYLGDLRALFAPPPFVTHIASLVDFALDAQPGAQHLVLALQDVDTAEAAAAMLDATEQIEAWIVNEQSAVLLVHCVEGRSRSAAVAIALLMRRDNLSFADAFAIVKKARPRIAPRQCFLDALSAHAK
jgi:protein-tyrosine phosphatase